ncbi:MAG: cohesin domain-containing protein [Terriglobales bacterium]
MLPRRIQTALAGFDRRRWTAAALLPFALLLVAHADQAKKDYNIGHWYFLHKEYDRAVRWYDRALVLKPDNAAYIVAARRAHFAAAVFHVQRGRTFYQEHRDAQALAEFEKAKIADPADFAGQQGINLVERREAALKAGQPVTARQVSELNQRLQDAGGPVELGAVANTPIRLQLTAGSRNAYRTVCQLAHLNVVFDPDYRSRPVALNLQNVTLLQALRILNLESQSFYTVVTPDTIFVAVNNEAKRRQLQDDVIKTFYFHNVTSPTDLTQISQAIRALVGTQHLQVVGSQMALVMRDTPDKVALAQKLIDDLDKAPPEVVVDVQVLQVSQVLMRDLGLLPPTQVTVGLQTPSSTSTNATTGATTTTTTSPTLNELAHLDSKDFSVTMSTAEIDAMLDNSMTNSIQSPVLRALEGQKATLQIGERVPIATGSFQPGIGGIGINPLVNTQFQYIPVGVNITLTPWVNGDDVTLDTSIEISAVDSYENIGGIQQPIIGQRKISHVIRLRAGESNILGGMFEDVKTSDQTGIPGLMDIPGLKWLFSRTNSSSTREEDLIVLTPHIVRRPDITRLNREALDTGTQNDIELRELPPATLASPAPATLAAAPAPAPALAGTSAAAAPPAAPVAAGPAVLSLAPARRQATVGKTFGLTIDLSHATAAYALTLQLNYDPRMLEVKQVMNAGFLSQGGQPVALVHREDPAFGDALISLSRPANASGVAGSGKVVYITFEAKAAGVTKITLSRVVARDPSGQEMPVHTQAATVNIQ